VEAEGNLSLPFSNQIDSKAENESIPSKLNVNEDDMHRTAPYISMPVGIGKPPPRPTRGATTRALG